MDFNWVKIKERLLSTCRTAFKEDPSLKSITDEEILEDIIILYNFNQLRLGYAHLDGTVSDFQTQLQDCFIDRDSSCETAKAFAESLDGFIKRLLIAMRFTTYNQVNELKLMGLVKEFNRQMQSHGDRFWGVGVPNFDTVSKSTLLNNGGGQYIFQQARMFRNLATHNALQLDMADVMRSVRYVSAFYVYLIHRTKHHLLLNYPDISKDISTHSNEKELTIDELRAYNFIAYGHHSQEVKSKYIDCFVLLYLFENGSQNEIQLKHTTQEFLGKIKTQISVRNSIKRLIADGMIELDKGNYTLTPDGTKLIEENRDNLITNKNRFHDDLKAILSEYNLQTHISEIEKKIISFIDKNALDIADTETRHINEEEMKSIISLCMKFGLDDEKSKKLIASIIKLCQSNDILIKLSLGKAVGKVTDMDQFSSKVKNMKRDVYLDSNVALYLICLNEDFPAGEFFDFKVGMALLTHVRDNKNLCLKISSVYLKEIQLNLKRALLLLTWEEIGWRDDYLPTNNLFYRHYISLKKTDGLPEDVESFADYLDYNFNLTIDDADLPDEDLKGVVAVAVRDKLAILRIEVVDNKYIEPVNINRSRRIFQDVIKEINSSKNEQQLQNDVLMGEHLFADDSYNMIFLSNDKSFASYRKRFSELYCRENPDIWLLFSASRFVGHVDLLNSKFNTKMLTDELLSLIETEDIKTISINLADVANRLVDVANLSGLKKKQHLRIVIKMISRQDKTEVFEINSDIAERTHRLNETWDKIRAEFSGKMDIKGFYKLLADTDFFTAIIGAIQKNLDDLSRSIMETYKEIDNLIANYQSDKN